MSFLRLKCLNCHDFRLSRRMCKTFHEDTLTLSAKFPAIISWKLGERASMEGREDGSNVGRVVSVGLAVGW